jgi:CRP-like cAMP-binding protein
MTQEKIAESINSAREVVARMLRQFVVDDLVELKRGCIVIKDEAGLEALL